MLPHVVRFNGSVVGDLYSELADLASANGQQQNDSAAWLAARLESLRDAARLPAKLSHWDVRSADVVDLARNAAEQWTAQFNPRPLSPSDFERIYACAL
jgi:alcohol dehydrogenase